MVELNTGGFILGSLRSARHETPLLAMIQINPTAKQADNQ
jgi:hypothetical protein